MSASKQPFDLSDLGHWQEVEQALHGDLRPLVSLLRSDEPLSRVLRDYIADEIEREPDKRFRRQRPEDLRVRENDRMLLYQVYSAKVAIVLKELGTDVDDHTLYEAQDRISDRKALDFLNEAYGIEITDDAVKNALRRTKPGIFDPRGPARRSKAHKLG